MNALVPLLLLTAAFAGPANPPKIGEKAPDVTWQTPIATSVTLSKLLMNGPVALVVLRGFPGYQCPICTVQVGELLGKSEAFAAAKTQVVLVYPGPAEGLKQRAEEFVRGKTLPATITLVLDPDYAFTNKYGLRWDAPRETAFPSTFVIDKSGKVIFAKISRSHGGRTKATEILEALPR
ncbi:redoxin domain-containing protein [Armatimonas sp.]|uniref:redoxin domain-containing protein n=1 Tax=Armatimonas sp. TaxID=1872638 RepID=UPI00286AF0C8|nr:redoxin domain-containing protein [Armatimonas sp.]